MKTVAKWLGLAAVAIACVGTTAQAEFAVPFNGHYYGLTTEATTWAEAEAEAVTLGGHLAAITSSAEQLFIEQAFLSFPGFPGSSIDTNPHQVLWIGLTDQLTEGDFRWTTGEALSFTNWKPGEPSDGFPVGEDYVAINWGYLRGDVPKGKWNDAPITGTTLNYGPGTLGPYKGIMEFTFDPYAPPVAAVPEPATLAMVCTAIPMGLGLAWKRRRKAVTA